MYDKIFRMLKRIATWRGFAILFILFFLATLGFEARQKRLGCENRSLDGRGWYSPGEAHAFLTAIGEGGRQLYAITEVTLDVLFPVIYVSLLAVLLINLYDDRNARRWVLVPLLAGVADLVENVLLAILAWSYQTDQVSSLANVAVVFTLAKCLLLLLTLVLIFVGAVKSRKRA